jgi:hypothetical protein
VNVDVGATNREMKPPTSGICGVTENEYLANESAGIGLVIVTVERRRLYGYD